MWKPLILYIFKFTKSNTSESLKKVLAGQIFHSFIYLFCPACLESLKKKRDSNYTLKYHEISRQQNRSWLHESPAAWFGLGLWGHILRKINIYNDCEQQILHPLTFSDYSFSFVPPLLHRPLRQTRSHKSKILTLLLPEGCSFFFFFTHFISTLQNPNSAPPQTIMNLDLFQRTVCVSGALIVRYWLQWEHRLDRDVLLWAFCAHRVRQCVHI